jgi:iron complex outermembrane receptor protein
MLNEKFKKNSVTKRNKSFRTCQLGAALLAILSAAAAAEVDQVSMAQTETMVVTATREAKARSELAESVGILDKQQIEAISPSHPAELLNRIAGVHINNLGGEGHMTAIRQPITTSGVYLFLEDGVPTRTTGLFNHNGLYEVNIPQAERVEVTKGPGSALYGSDAIGGVINLVTQQSPEQTELQANVEGGSYGWKRGLFSYGAPINDDHGFILNLNVTENDGYRDASDYQRYSVSSRVDGLLSQQTNYKVMAAYTSVDQSGVSDLEEDDYKNNPTKNKYHGDVGSRDVSAFRLTSEFSTALSDDTLLTFTPFYRYNNTEMMPSWMVTYDPNLRAAEFQSFGLLSKYRKNFSRGEFIAGLDMDHTLSEYTEQQVTVDQVDDIFTGFQESGRTNYNFDATQTSLSPYLHGEWQATESIRLIMGARYDYFYVDYTDKLGADTPEKVGYKAWYRPDSQNLHFDHLSPKLGAVYSLNKAQQIYTNYRNAFRTPSIGQLFRSGSTVNTTELEPVESDSIELGWRSAITPSLYYDVTLYHMIVKNKIVSYLDGQDRNTVNAGKTTHQGIEVAVNGQLTDEWGLDFAFTYTQQEYDEFQYIYTCYPPACDPKINETRNYAGFDVGKAPDTMGQLAVNYSPEYIPGLTVEVEWEHLGQYYTDETNTATYDGHDLVNLRASYWITDDIAVRGRIMNLTDQLYSTYTSNQVGSPAISYRPGMPISYYLGFEARY